MEITRNVVKRRIVRRRKINRRPLILSFIIVITFLFIFSTIGPTNSYGDGEIEYIETHVEVGDSLWSIAAKHTDSNDDIRRTLSHIVKANNIQSSIIYPGQLIKIPKL